MEEGSRQHTQHVLLSDPLTCNTLAEAERRGSRPSAWPSAQNLLRSAAEPGAAAEGNVLLSSATLWPEPWASGAETSASGAPGLSFSLSLPDRQSDGRAEPLVKAPPDTWPLQLLVASRCAPVGNRPDCPYLLSTSRVLGMLCVPTPLTHPGAVSDHSRGRPGFQAVRQGSGAHTHPCPHDGLAPHQGQRKHRSGQ